ncbi:conjugal transfer protein [Streptomyces sp. NPDC086766]|uniref:conjugal transfer protein n=1 Tax=Streptomyces sp. NPDC086766 TaxID=3365754 RepID=UPI0038115CCA
MAAGARLERMRRRVRLSRLALFTAIAAGPVALGVAVMSGPATVAATSSTTPAAVHTAAAAADPSGYAQMFVDAWLRSDADDPTSAQARLAHSLAPDVDLPAPAADAQPRLESVTAVRSARRDSGAWAVTVAAQYADGQVRYYVVPLDADSTSGAYTVTGVPGVVAGPKRAGTVKSAYAVTVASGSDLSSAIGQFLAAYLTGAGEVDRYLAPGVSLPPVTPAPYTAVTVHGLQAVEEAAASGAAPGDGSHVHVRAVIEARDEEGRWPLAYELTLTARSGRWDVASLENGTAGEGGRP